MATAEPPQVMYVCVDWDVRPNANEVDGELLCRTCGEPTFRYRRAALAPPASTDTQGEP